MIKQIEITVDGEVRYITQCEADKVEWLLHEIQRTEKALQNYIKEIRVESKQPSEISWFCHTCETGNTKKSGSPLVCDKCLTELSR